MPGSNRGAALLIDHAPGRSHPQSRAIHLRISAMAAPSARLAPRNHLVGGNPMRPMTTMITAIISPATPPPTGILLIFMPGCASSAICARFNALPSPPNVPLRIPLVLCERWSRSGVWGKITTLKPCSPGQSPISPFAASNRRAVKRRLTRDWFGDKVGQHLV